MFLITRHAKQILIFSTILIYQLVYAPLSTQDIKNVNQSIEKISKSEGNVEQLIQQVEHILNTQGHDSPTLTNRLRAKLKSAKDLHEKLPITQPTPPSALTQQPTFAPSQPSTPSVTTAPISTPSKLKIPVISSAEQQAKAEIESFFNYLDFLNKKQSLSQKDLTDLNKTRQELEQKLQSIQEDIASGSWNPTAEFQKLYDQSYNAVTRADQILKQHATAGITTPPQLPKTMPVQQPTSPVGSSALLNQLDSINQNIQAIPLSMVRVQAQTVAVIVQQLRDIWSANSKDINAFLPKEFRDACLQALSQLTVPERGVFVQLQSVHNNWNNLAQPAREVAIAIAKQAHAAAGQLIQLFNDFNNALKGVSPQNQNVQSTKEWLASNLSPIQNTLQQGQVLCESLFAKRATSSETKIIITPTPQSPTIM